MSRLLEILGKAITVNTAELIWHWLNTVRAQNQSNPDYDEFEEILELIADMDLAAADEKLRFYLFENPSCTLGRMAAAAIFLHTNQLDQAVQTLQSIYLREPNNTMALYTLGHCYERLGHDTEAVEFYQDCLKFKHYLQLPRQRLAAIYFKNGQLEKVIHEYELLVKEYGDDISSLVILGHLYIANSEYNRAVEIFDKAILIHPDNFHTDENYFHVEPLIKGGRLYEAADYLRRMLTEAGDRADLIVRLADVSVMLNEHTEAIVNYEKALRLQPNYLEATVKLGTEHLRLQHYSIAARHFNQAAEINDQIVDAYLGLAIAQKLAGRPKQALTTLSLASAIQANSSLLFAETATLQLKAAQELPFDTPGPELPVNLIDAVIDAHHNQLRARPQNPDLHYRLGLLLMATGRLEKATSTFRNAISINQTFHRAHSKLAVCLYETNRNQHALEQLTQVGAIDKEILQLHYKTALLYCNKTEFAAAIRNLERLYTANFTNADAAINISVVLRNLGLVDTPTAIWQGLADTTNESLAGDETPKI